jgi:hypothetical protein
MSPEQSRGLSIDERSDVYSLGVTLYELTTGGKGPWSADRSNVEAVLGDVQTGNALSLRTLAPEAPAGLVSIIEKAMRFAPLQRYQSAAELLADLERLSAGQEPSSAVAVAVPPESAPAPRAGRSRSVAAAILAGGLVLVLALFVVRALWPTPQVTQLPATKPVEEVRTAPEFFPWPDNPLPESRRRRTFGEALPLLKTERPEPIWSVRLQGPEKCFLTPPGQSRLFVQNLPSDFPTILLLDYDPKHNWYIYDVRIQPTLRKNEPGPPAGPPCEAGIVFGYRRNAGDPTKRHPFFVAKFEESAEGGKLLVGSCFVEEAEGGRAPLFVAFRAFPPPWGELSLPPFQRSKGERQLRVRAQDDKVTLTVDEKHSLPLDLPALRAAVSADHGNADLDPRGGVGFWVHKGVGLFSDASVTLLPSERPGP